MFFTVLFVLLLAELGVSTKYSDCGSQLGTFKSAKIFDCNDDPDQQCDVKTGTKQNVEISFELSDAVSQLTSSASARIYGRIVQVPVENNDACKDSGLDCPLDKDKPYTYKTTVTIPSYTPKVSSMIKWELRDASNTTAICVSLQVNLK